VAEVCFDSPGLAKALPVSPEMVASGFAFASPGLSADLSFFVAIPLDKG
jgi:hypothetical protein